MPFEKVEFSFPDEQEESSDIEVKSSSAIKMVTPSKESAKSDDADFEVEIVDDTPKADRGRKVSDPPDEVTDEELEDYSDKVRNRIKHFSKGYHDERRAKETAFREREELERYTQQLIEENKGLKSSQTKNQTVLLDQAKRSAGSELEIAKREFKEAHEAGDTDALVEAQDKLTTAKIKADRLSNIQLPSLQEQETAVEEVSTQPAPVPVDKRANEWAEDNPWFGSDDEMTSYVLGLHNKLAKQGMDLQSDEYYETINSRMRKIFPEEFEDIEEEEKVTPKRQANVVAPATRSTSPKKIVLTQTQVNLAKRLGVSLEDYAKQVAIEMRKDANG
jgi:hypothetical protein|tara:strand:+ start:302 stop:1300 length:999 start_codon:yes stop_codon:yes gene_type:complete